MNLNEKIILNLENLFRSNFLEIKNLSIGHWLDLLKVENPDIYSINEQKTVKLYDESTLRNFKLAKENKKLLKCYEKAIELSFDESEIINRFSKDLKLSFEEIKEEIKLHSESKIQIIILTYDQAPYAWIDGFGEGDYPILNQPEYFDFNFQIDFFEFLGKVDYAYTWDNMIKLEENLEEAKVFDEIFDTEYYQCIRNCYIFKTYILLNKAFKMNENELFANLDIKKPLFIYGHEYGCELMNIYCLE